ncbi:hypothetical protein J2847_001075 [Azospirillum agricola]|uniref:tripartite tricarboxylate transporter TctB family protein n=1 Tax=Azospirillum agricola TaxID=1720247 RepID=UPI001AE87FB6|nr:tripartite tricarboxylate transporter TctB family protein [Azospirillum agricola]MBP2227793.1 hypothetical protein [Azospirillum agricola]
MSNAPVQGGGAGAPLSTKIANLVIAVILIAVAAAAIASTGDFPKTLLAADVGPARFPVIHASMLIVLSLILIANTLRMPTIVDDTPPVGVIGYVGVALGILATAVCLVAMAYVGYALATVVYMAALMWLMGQRSPLWNPVIAVAVTALIYVTFQSALGVPLPVGSLFE